MGIDQHGTTSPPANMESGYRLTEEIQAEHDAARGILYAEGTKIIIIELERPEDNMYPLDFTLDEVIHSLNIFSDRTGLPLDNAKVMPNRRASFSARLPIETCDRLEEQGFIDLHYTSDRSENGIECLEFQVYATNGKGIKTEDPVRDARKAEREADRERRNALLVTLHFNLGRDLLMLLATSPIFGTIKQNILSTAEKVFGNDPNTRPQHMNLIEVKTMEGADAHALRLYVVLNDSFYGKDAKDLHATFDLSPLKYFWGIDQLIFGRMSSTQLNQISAKPCCYRFKEAPRDLDGKLTTYSCPAPDGACDLKSQALKYFRSNTAFDTPFETFAEQRKRKREEKARELKAAAEVQRANVQVKVCKKWENEGSCRYLFFLGYQRCARDHPDEETRSRNIECCSSSARPNPKRCYLKDTCPYRGHNQNI